MAQTQKLNALVVDDHNLVRQSLITLLSSRFLNISFDDAMNGNAAYEKIIAAKPDILYTDIQMPQGNGDDLLERLVNESIFIPNIVLTFNLNPSLQNARALFYSQRMYTLQQRMYLGITLMQANSPQDYLNQIINSQQEIDTVTRIINNAGFSAFEKGSDVKILVEKTRLILYKIYGIR